MSGSLEFENDSPELPYEIFNPGGSARLLLVCDHATAIIPQHYDRLGLDTTILHRHVAWDIGAADVTRRVARALDATAVLSRFSRLLIDPNRPLDHPTLVVAESDGMAIPGNRDLRPDEVERRVGQYYRPYHQAIREQMARLRENGGTPAFVAIHSFTPAMNGFRRPWHIGLLWNQDPRMRDLFLAAFENDSSVVIGDNEPYTGQTHNHTADTYGTDAGLPHISIEFRQDLIDTPGEADRWAALLTEKLAQMLTDDSLFAIEHYGRSEIQV
jgi:predicted N-formylglutamate amidohydrolase